MIVMLQPDQISAFWPAIKHTIMIACRPDEREAAVFCNKVLQRLLSGKAQCWVGMHEREDGRHIDGVGITTIEESSLGETYLFLHSLYAFTVIPEENLNAIIPTLEKFCRNRGISKMLTFTRNQRLRDYYASQGFTQDPTLFIKEL